MDNGTKYLKIQGIRCSGRIWQHFRGCQDPELFPVWGHPHRDIFQRGHPLAHAEKFPVKSLQDDPFIMLEKGTKAEITEIYLKNGLTPKPKYTTFDDYAALSMVEKGLGIAILPKLILQRVSYDVVVKPLDVEAYRTIGVAMKSEKELSLAAQRFLEYLDCREGEKEDHDEL